MGFCYIRSKKRIMKIEQLYTNCLAEAAYLLECDGQAVIIDPLRDIQSYLDLLEERDLKLTHILETHFHADFVSGHIDLAKATGAKIVFGPNAVTNYDAHIAVDGEIIQLGDHQIKVLHTPGHTVESSCFLLVDANGDEKALFSGDTLFIGDVGRPDLAVKSDLTTEDLAGHLYDSIQNKIMPLSNDVIVYPAHGAGSSCGKNLSSETFDTLGNQKKNNYALNQPNKKAFVKEVTDGILPPPSYFPKAAVLNKTGYTPVDEVLGKVNALDLDTFKSYLSKAEILDTRHQKDFCIAHVPNTTFIGIDGGFAIWAGTVLTDLHKEIVFVADPGREKEVVTRLTRVGFDNIVGYLEGGFETWKNAGEALATLDSITPEALKSLTQAENINIIDARKLGEFEAGHIDSADHQPLDYIHENHVNYNSDDTYYIHCRSGYRSVVAASILRQKGVKNVVDLAGGFVALEKSNLFNMCTETACTAS